MAKAKRKAISKDTLRELYLKCGNQCAFPGCTRVMINSDGIFIGQICHIEAAEYGGERFNEDQTDDERAEFPNLMLMCYDHHQVTNDVHKYTVPILQAMKAAHEAKFTDIAKIISDSISDEAIKTEIKPSTSLKAMNDLCQWGLNEEELTACVEDVTWLAGRLKMLPVRTRQLLVVIASRLKRHKLPNGQPDYDSEVALKEISEACQLAGGEIIGHIKIMEKYGVATLTEDDEWPYEAVVQLRECPSGWFLFGTLREFARKKNIPIKAILEDLHFDLLD